MKNQVEEIKAKLDIVQFVGKYVKLSRAGRNLKGVCPFHQEKSPSFIVSPDRQIWHCFGSCGVGGDVISFLMKWENVSFYEALVELAKQTGVELLDNQFDNKQWQYHQKLIAINNLALKYYNYLLTKTHHAKVAYEYLKNRQINEVLMQTFELGYAPASWDSLFKFLLKKGFNTTDIAATGLIIPSSDGRHYDRFRNRLMFPLKDSKGNTLGFSGRILDSSLKEAKYINSKETELYHKREHLFGLHLTKEAIRKEDNVYIVEGEFDLITPYRLGISNIVAIKGAAFTKEQLNILKRFTKKITLALDMDEAGVEAVKRGIKIAENLDVEVFVATLSKGKDPDEAGMNDALALKKDLKSAVPIYDFLINDCLKRYPEKTPFQKKKLVEEVAPYLTTIKNSIIQSHYLKQLSNLLEVSESSIFRSLNEVNRNLNFKINKTNSKEKATIQRAELLQNYLLGAILQTKKKNKDLEKIPLILSDIDFETPSFGKIFSVYFNWYAKSESDDLSYSVFIDLLPAELRSVADEVFLRASGDEMADISFSLVKIANEIKKNSLQRQMNQLIKNDAEENQEKLKEITNKYNILRKSELT